MPKIILASMSERRRKLLESLGLDFEVIESGFNESVIRAHTPEQFVIDAAGAKADAVIERVGLKRMNPESIILAADTVVVLDSEILGKPRDRAEAVSMLRALSGRSHFVVTGVVLKSAKDEWKRSERSEVHFKVIPEVPLQDYVGSGAAYDKAGGYGIQELGPDYIEAVDGDLSNVVGLPLGLLREGLNEFLGEDLLACANLRGALLRAYPDLKALRESLLAGVPDGNPD